MHAQTGLSFGWYVILVLWLLLLAGVVAIAVDSLRPARRAALAAYVEATGAKRLPLTVYTVAAASLLGLWFAPFLPVWNASVMTAITAAGTIGGLAALVLIPAYLLRVIFPVYPKGAAAAGDSAADGPSLPVDSSDTPEGA